MALNTFCQSCCMPLDNDQLLGTEKDGSKSHLYCTYCYRNGAFVNPSMKLEEMTSFLKVKMAEMHLSQDIINYTVRSLPHLKRWMT